MLLVVECLPHKAGVIPALIPRTAKSNKTCEVDSAYKLVERTINEISFGNYWKALLEQWTFSRNSKDKQLDRDAGRVKSATLVPVWTRKRPDSSPRQRK